MEMKQFYEQVEARVMEILKGDYPDIQLDRKHIEKTSEGYEGLCVMDTAGPSIYPTLNLDRLYTESGGNPEVAANDVVELYKDSRINLETNMQSEIGEIASVLKSYDRAKSTFVVAPISPSRADVLSDIPQQERNGMHFVVKMQLSKQEGSIATATVHYSHMATWGVEKEQMFKDAWVNTKELRPCNVKTMAEVLIGSMGGGSDLPPDMLNQIESESPNMFVFTNTDKLEGAVGLFCEGAMEAAAEVLGENYYVLPSSVHELILVPENVIDVREVDTLRDMVSDVNTSIVSDDEILSDMPFHYDAKEKLFENIEEFKERMSLENNRVSFDPQEVSDRVINALAM